VSSGARVLASIVAVVILGAVFGALVVDSAGAPGRDGPVAPLPGAVEPWASRAFHRRSETSLPPA